MRRSTFHRWYSASLSSTRNAVYGVKRLHSCAMARICCRIGSSAGFTTAPAAIPSGAEPTRR